MLLATTILAILAAALYIGLLINLMQRLPRAARVLLATLLLLLGTFAAAGAALMLTVPGTGLGPLVIVGTMGFSFAFGMAIWSVVYDAHDPRIADRPGGEVSAPVLLWILIALRNFLVVRVLGWISPEDAPRRLHQATFVNLHVWRDWRTWARLLLYSSPLLLGAALRVWARLSPECGSSLAATGAGVEEEEGDLAAMAAETCAAAVGLTQ